MLERINGLLTHLGVLTARPAAFAILVVYAVLWLALDRESLDGTASPLWPPGS